MRGTSKRRNESESRLRLAQLPMWEEQRPKELALAPSGCDLGAGSACGQAVEPAPGLPSLPCGGFSCPRDGIQWRP